MQTEHQKRIEDRSIPVPESGCWLWTGQVGKNGYGRDPIGARQNYLEAHRSSYMAFKGQIASGLVVRHKCDTPICVNPTHLQLGTPADNMRDRFKHRNSASPLTCLHGHLMSGSNVYMYRGRASCKQCNRDACLRYQKRKQKEQEA